MLDFDYNDEQIAGNHEFFLSITADFLIIRLKFRIIHVFLSQFSTLAEKFMIRTYFTYSQKKTDSYPSKKRT